MATPRILVGLSTCLLGEKVRFDAGHKHDRYITDVLGAYFEFTDACPELEVGMGVPREPVRLVGSVARPSMVGIKSGEDWTERMERYSAERVRALGPLDLSGFILKSDSPSCGMERVKVYAKNGIPLKTGRGLFAAALMEAFPHLPVEEEGRLNDAKIRESFIVRVFRYHHLQNLLKNWSRNALVEFHTVHKYLMLAHSPVHYSRLGRVVAEQKGKTPSEVKEKYAALFMEGLAVKATVKKHVNVLQHIMGYFRDEISDAERKDLLATIEDYRRELVPLIVPMSLINHYVRTLDTKYIRNQVYLNPHPKELMLRNHV